MKRSFRISKLRTISFLVAVILAVPLSLKGLTGLFVWFSPFIMLNSVFSLKSFVLLNGLGILILVLILFRKRWFCNHLCPVGWSCDKVSGFSNKTFVYRRIPDIGKWLAIISIVASLIGIPLFIIFDPLAIFHGFFSIFSGGFDPVEILFCSFFPLLLLIHLFLPGIWCKKICPLGGLQVVADEAKNILKRYFNKTDPDNLVLNHGRRYFLISGIGLATGLVVPRFLKPSEEIIIRPPAAVKPGLFNLLCCRCGNCSRSCPTSIIKPVTDSAYPLSWMTPGLKFINGYCLETCNLCSRVCPTGAITLFNVEAKSELFIGTAEIELKNCLLVNNKECVKCKESCKYESIEFSVSGNILNSYPLISKKSCVGCGACAVVCPQQCILINPSIADLKILS
jgi:ferredoxin